MARRGRIRPKRIIFVATEGRSERAFARFLERCCDQAGLHVHLDVKLGTGGDSLAVVEEAGRRLDRHPDKQAIKRRLVLLDQDRMDEDRRSGRDARVAARRWGLQLVVQEPNLEGLLLRLHRGEEQRQVPANAALRELRGVWPDYHKPPSADALSRRFDLSHLRRAAKYDDNLKELL